MAIHVSLGFSQYKDSPFGDFAVGVHDGLLHNATVFVTPVVTPANLKLANDDLTSKIAAAVKGSVAQHEARDAARAVVDDLLRQLAIYVEGVAMGDESIIRLAGFQVASHTHGASTPLVKPVILAILSEMSTQLHVRVGAQANVGAYEAQYSTAPEVWQAGGIFKSTRGIIIESLTPGTTYTIRVRAIGGSTGYSDWSDPVSHMCS